MTRIKDLIAFLETFAPPSFQESYDNSGLIVGNAEDEISGVLICLDSTEEIIDEAIRMKCNMVIAHHPIVFSGLKKITGNNYVERTIIKAIKNDIAVYAIHTNLDNVELGVNRMIATRLGLTDLRILSPKKDLLQKLVTFCPSDHSEAIKNALFKAGAGNIGNYDRCSFSISGTGTFRPGNETDPYIGKPGEDEKVSEDRIEVIFEAHKQHLIIQTLLDAHPYEEVAYDIYHLQNIYQSVGSGMVGRLKEPMEEMAFLQHVKNTMEAKRIRHTALLGKKISKIAICGGSGSFLLKDAIRAGAEVFITADYKYHQFFDADGRIVIADIGHFESEQFTIQLLNEVISKKFTTFAVRLTKISTNPVHYM